MSDYLEIKIFDKIYTQRTKFGKVQEFSHDGIKIQSYDEAPIEIQKIIDKTTDIEKNPKIYFDYDEIDNGIIIKKIHKDAYNNFMKIPEYINEKPIIKIETNAFDNNYKDMLVQIQLPETIKELNSRCFSNLKNLKYINIPKNITNLPDYCFSGCNILKEINVSHVNKIGIGTFMDCKDIKKIDLSNAVRIASMALYGCKNLKKVTLSNEIKIIPSLFVYDCVSLEEMPLPDSIVLICSESFFGCKQYNPEKMPENLADIDDEAFSCSGIKKLQHPKILQLLVKRLFIIHP